MIDYWVKFDKNNGFIYNFFEFFRMIKRTPRIIKDIFTRGIYGCCTYDVWDFDGYMSRVIIRGLTQMRNVTIGYSGDIYCDVNENFDGETQEEKEDIGMSIWLNILTDIIDGFQAYIDEEDSAKREETDWAFELFSYYFGGLWLQF